ncbi:MAG: transglycosylase domain-containing protein [Clostridia bacterium]
MEKKNKLGKPGRAKSKKFGSSSVKKVDKGIINGATPSQGATKGKKGKKNRKTSWKVFRVILFVLLALFIIGAGAILGVITGVIDKTDSIGLDELQLFKLTSFVYDKDGKEIGTLFDSENRVTIEYKDIPEQVVNAITAIEDERFFKHNGVDIKRTIGAVGTFVLNGGKSSFGGSTITQQLVKNVTSDNETSWTRKIREWYRAIVLETKISKEQIFESYVNTIYLGDGSYGIEVASENYFGKSVKDVNIAEAAVLGAIIQSPESTNPYKSEEAKKKLMDRQKVVLDKMLKLGKITKEQHDEALNYKIDFKKEKVNINSKVQTYYVDAVVEQVIADLREQKNVSRGVAIKMLYSDGYKIYTPQDPTVQNAINDAYDNPRLFYKDRQGEFMQSSMVVMDQSNGNIVGLIGGAGEKSGDLTLNRATQSHRQPGSCMKPLGAYGPAFEQGESSPGAGLDDTQFTQGKWTPGNYYNYFNGYVTARQAIAKSMNIPAVKANQKVDKDFAYNFAKNTGLESLVPADKNAASLALGGVTKGFTAVEMANAYATIANGGVHMEPKLYTKVEDRNGKEVLVQDTTAKKVMKDSTAYMLTNCLEEVIKTGTAAGSVKVPNMATAGKTGNTNDDYDQWFCGYTPYYTIACWNGYDQNKAINRPYPYFCMRLFNTVMNSITKGKASKQFNRPDTVTEAPLCRLSGLVSTEACKADPRGDQTGTDLVAKGSIPTAKCNVHKMVKICNETGMIATGYCPSTSSKSFITREGNPAIKSSDWRYMVPSGTCNVHTRPGATTNKPSDSGSVNIY